MEANTILQILHFDLLGRRSISSACLDIMWLFNAMLRYYVVIQCLFGTQFFVTDIADFLPSYLVMHSLDVLDQAVSSAECLVALHT